MSCSFYFKKFGGRIFFQRLLFHHISPRADEPIFRIPKLSSRKTLPYCYFPGMEIPLALFASQDCLSADLISLLNLFDHLHIHTPHRVAMLRCHFQDQTATGKHGLWRCIPVGGALCCPYHIHEAEISFSPQNFNGAQMNPQKTFSNNDESAIRERLPSRP